jgi:hypothetical protein
MIYKLRLKFSRQFEKRFGYTLREDAIIENAHGKGYRLNPKVRVVDPSEITLPD